MQVRLEVEITAVSAPMSSERQSTYAGCVFDEFGEENAADGAAPLPADTLVAVPADALVAIPGAASTAMPFVVMFVVAVTLGAAVVDAGAETVWAAAGIIGRAEARTQNER